MTTIGADGFDNNDTVRVDHFSWLAIGYGSRSDNRSYCSSYSGLDVIANIMTVKSLALAATIAATPLHQTVIAGQTNISSLILLWMPETRVKMCRSTASRRLSASPALSADIPSRVQRSYQTAICGTALAGLQLVQIPWPRDGAPTDCELHF